jgi:hypothetical protein
MVVDEVNLEEAAAHVALPPLQDRPQTSALTMLCGWHLLPFHFLQVA